MTSSNVACDKISNNYLNLVLTYGRQSAGVTWLSHLSPSARYFSMILFSHSWMFHDQLQYSKTSTGLAGLKGHEPDDRIQHVAEKRILKFRHKIRQSCRIFKIIFSNVMGILFAFLTKNTDYNFTQTCCLYFVRRAGEVAGHDKNSVTISSITCTLHYTLSAWTI